MLKIPKHEFNALSKPLIQIVTEYFQNPENQKKFEEWHFKKYGYNPTKASYIKNKEDLKLCAN